MKKPISASSHDCEKLKGSPSRRSMKVLACASLELHALGYGVIGNMRKNISPCVMLAVVLVVATAAGQTAYQSEVKTWRAQQEAELKVDQGWLTLAGLHWLKDGPNSFGAARGNDLMLPVNSAPGKVGVFELQHGMVTLTVADGVNVNAAGQPVRTVQMQPDTEQKPTKINVGSLTLIIIKRGERYGVRFWDVNNPRRKEFKGLRWFPVQEQFRLTAKFISHEQPTELSVPNVLGDVLKMPSPGSLRFNLNGREYSLEPVSEEDGKLFIIFRDKTSGKETYAGGRFLYADAPVNGEVTLDFNKAVNPPCAFTPFATCPLPPKQNRLAVAIEAGEQNYETH